MSPDKLLPPNETTMESTASLDQTGAPAKRTSSRTWIVLLVLLAIASLIVWRIYTAHQQAAAAAQ